MQVHVISQMLRKDPLLIRRDFSADVVDQDQTADQDGQVHDGGTPQEGIGGKQGGRHQRLHHNRGSHFGRAAASGRREKIQHDVKKNLNDNQFE